MHGPKERKNAPIDNRKCGLDCVSSSRLYVEWFNEIKPIEKNTNQIVAMKLVIPFFVFVCVLDLPNFVSYVISMIWFYVLRPVEAMPVAHSRQKAEKVNEANGRAKMKNGRKRTHTHTDDVVEG